MKLSIALAVAVSVVVTGADAAMCPSTSEGLPPTGFQSTVHITSSGQDRTYALFVPPGYDPGHAYALTFGFHGDGGTGPGIRNALGLEAPANGAAIFVYPDATVASGQSFDLDSPLATNEDMTLVQDILASLETLYCVDLSLVFATGFSRGGYFANFLNCRIGAATFRAIAPQAGSGPYGADYDDAGHFICEATAAAALLIHGASDTVVPIPDAAYSRDQWIFANQCSNTTTAYKPSPCASYNGCSEDKPVVWCAVPGLGHAIWTEAAATTWSFFASFATTVPEPASSLLGLGSLGALLVLRLATDAGCRWAAQERLRNATSSVTQSRNPTQRGYIEAPPR